MKRVVMCTPTLDGIPDKCASSMGIARAYFRAKTDATVPHVVVKGAPLPDARYELLARARERNATHVLWCDDDTVVPKDAIDRLVRDDRAIVSAAMWRKRPDSDNVPCFGWHDPTLYGMWVYGGKPWFTDEIFPVDVCGFGLILTDVAVFDAIEDTGQRPFNWNWLHTIEMGKARPRSRLGRLLWRLGWLPKTHRVNNFIPQGEDIWFCLRAAECGYRTYVDSSVKAGHYDRLADRAYPSEGKWIEYGKATERVIAFKSFEELEGVRARVKRELRARREAERAAQA